MPRLNQTAALRFAVRIALASSVLSFQSYATTAPNRGCDNADNGGRVRAMAGALRHCYTDELAKHPQLAGKIVVQWTIQADGRVKWEKVLTDTVGNPAVAKCLMETIAGIQFQKPEPGVCVIQWPFVFRPPD